MGGMGTREKGIQPGAEAREKKGVVREEFLKNGYLKK